MGLAPFPYHGIEIDVGPLPRQPRIEGGGGLAAGLADLIGFEGAFDDIGYGTALAAREPMGKVAGLGAAYRKLGLPHHHLLYRA